MDTKIIKQLKFVADELSKPFALAGLNYLVSENETKEFKKTYGITIKEAEEAIKIVSKHLTNTINSLKK